VRAAPIRLLTAGLVVSIASLLVAAPPSEPKYKLVLQAPPALGVDSVVVSPDGSLVATGSEGGVRLYDATSGAFLRGIGNVGGRDIVFSPDGRTIAGAGFHMDKLVALYDVQSGKRLLNLPGHTEWEVYAMALSPDGKLLASTATDKQILVWELASGKLRHQLRDQPEKIAALAFSPDSRLLASGGGDRVVKLWDMASGKVRRTLAGHRDWVCGLAFAPDGKTIASASCDWGFHRGHDWPRPPIRGTEKCEWRLWEVETGNLRRTVSDQGRMLAIAIAPDGKSVACGVERELRLYNLGSESPPQVLTRHEGAIMSLAFTPGGAAIVSGSHDQTTRRTHVATGKVEWQAPGYFEQVNSVALSDDGSVLVTGSSDQRFARSKLPATAKELGPGTVRLWDARTSRLVRRLGDTTVQIMAVAVSGDGGKVVGGGATADGAGSVRVWDSATGNLVWSKKDHEMEVLAAAFSSTGESIVTADAKGLVKIRDATSGRVLHTLADHKGGATAVAISPNGKTVYCAEANGGARAWDMATGRLLRTCKMGESVLASPFTVDRRMTSIGLSRDGGTLAMCASSVNNEWVDATTLWDARTGALVRNFAAEKIHGQPMALSPDGSIVATGGKSVKLWDVRTGKMLREFTGHLKRTQSIVFSADGQLIIAGGSYGTTNAWEVATGRHLVTLFAFGQPEKQTDDWLAYMPEGHYDGSPGSERYLAWRVGDDLLTPASLRVELHRPEKIEAALKIESSKNASR
jgi:WD40 repeat protein